MPSATVTAAAIADAFEGGASGVIRFTRTGDTSSSLGIDLSIGGTADNGTDYDYVSFPVEFANGESTVDVHITAGDDASYDPNETVTLTVISGMGDYVPGTPAAATIHIVDASTPIVTVTKLADTTEGGTAGTFRVSRTGSTSSSLTGNFTIGGTATSGTDFTSISTAFTIAASATYVDISVAALADNLVEGSETVTLTLSDGGSNYYAATTGTVSLNITDETPTITVAKGVDAVEAESNGTFVFTRTGGDLSTSLTVGYTVGGTATPGTDYATLTGSVTFAANSATAIISVASLRNGIEEATDLTVSATVTGGTYHAVGNPSSASLAIIDTDMTPTAFDSAVMTTQNSPADVAVLDLVVDLNGVGVTLTHVTDGEHGAVVINGDGTVTYTPDTDYAGDDSFTYTVEDPFGNESTGTVTVLVTSPQAPSAPVWTATGTAVTIDVPNLAFDPAGNTLTTTAVSQGSHGSVVINGTGTVTYTPDTGFNGDDTFTYTVADGSGNAATATVTVTVGITDPVALDSSASTDENTAVTVSLADLVFQPAGGSITTTAVTQGSHGSVSINTDGSVTYTPGSGYTGPDTFTYTVTDSGSRTATGTITVQVGPAVADEGEEIDDDLNAILADISDYVSGTATSIATALNLVLPAFDDYVNDATSYISTHNPDTGAGLSYRDLLTEMGGPAVRFYSAYIDVHEQENLMWAILMANKSLLVSLKQQLMAAEADPNPSAFQIGVLRATYQTMVSIQVSVLKHEIKVWKNAKMSEIAALKAYEDATATYGIPPAWLTIPPATPFRSFQDALP